MNIAELEKHLRFLGPRGDDEQVAAQLRAMRDQRIRDFLTDKDTPIYRAGLFLRATLGGQPEAARECRELKIPMAKAQVTSPGNADGGFLVPTETSNAIISLIEKFGVVRAEATTWPMASDQQIVPRSTENFTAGWLGEALPAALTVATFDAISLVTKKLAAFIKVSEELMEDSVPALGAFFIAGSALAFAKVEDETAFLGDGTSTYRGIAGIQYILNDGGHAGGKYTAASGHTTFATLDAVDIGNAIAKLPARAVRNAKLYISVAGYGAALVRLAGASGGLVASIGPDGTLRANWHGLPVVFTQALPSSTGSLAGKLMLAVGDLSQAVAFGVRRDLTVQSFTETFPEFDQRLIRATERIDLDVHDLGDSDSAGALVGVFGAAS